MYVLGLYSDGEYFKVSLLYRKGKKIRIEFLKEFKKNITNLNVLKKILDTKLSFFNSSVEVVSALSSDEIFVKNISIPFQDLRKVKKALEFQLSSEGVYSESNRFFVPTYKKRNDDTLVTLYGYTKEAMESHLQEVKTLGIESEWICTISRAFERFIQYFTPIEESFFLFHLGWESSFLYYIDQKEIKKDVPLSIGLKHIIDAVQKDQVEIENVDMQSMQQFFFEAIEQGGEGAIRDVFFDIEKEISRAWTYMIETEDLAKDVKKILFTGYGDFSRELKSFLPSIDFKQVTITPHLEYSTAQIGSYAIEIGLALDRALSDKRSLQLAGGDFFPAVQKKKAKKYLLSYALLSLGSTMMFFFMFNAYYIKKSNLLKRRYEIATRAIFEVGETKSPKRISYSASNLGAMRKKIMQLVKEEKQKAKLCQGPTGLVQVLVWLEICNIEEYIVESFSYNVCQSPEAENPLQDYLFDFSFIVRKSDDREKIEKLKISLENPSSGITFVSPIEYEELEDSFVVKMRVKP